MTKNLDEDLIEATIRRVAEAKAARETGITEPELEDEPVAEAPPPEPEAPASAAPAVDEDLIAATIRRVAEAKASQAAVPARRAPVGAPPVCRPSPRSRRSPSRGRWSRRGRSAPWLCSLTSPRATMAGIAPSPNCDRSWRPRGASCTTSRRDSVPPRRGSVTATTMRRALPSLRRRLERCAAIAARHPRAAAAPGDPARSVAPHGDGRATGARAGGDGHRHAADPEAAATPAPRAEART